MKIASVDRIGSWRPPNAETRAVTANRLQTIAAGSASSVEQQTLTSGTELPPLPVQKTQEAMSRPVLQSDRSAEALVAYAQSSVPVSQGESVPTVNAFKGTASADKADRTTDSQSKTNEAGGEKAASKTLLELAQSKQNPENLTALEIATQAAAGRAAAQAKREAAQPPQVPLSKMLMDQVKSLWDASSKAVEASLAPPSTSTAGPTEASSSGNSTVDVTYSVPRHGAGSN